MFSGFFSRIWSWSVVLLPMLLAFWTGHLVLSSVRDSAELQRQDEIMHQIAEARLWLRRLQSSAMANEGAEAAGSVQPSDIDECRAGALRAIAAIETDGQPGEAVLTVLGHARPAVERVHEAALALRAAPQSPASHDQLRRQGVYADSLVESISQTQWGLRDAVWNDMQARGKALILVALIACLTAILAGLTLSGVRAANDARQLAEAERDRFFHHSFDMLCIADFDARIRQVNAAWKRELGLADDVLLGKRLFDIVDPADRDSMVNEYRRLVKGESASGFVVRVPAADGSQRWLLWTATPDHRRGLFYAGARDITDIRRTQEQLAQEHLRLEQSQHDLETRNRELQDFAYVASHDLQEPLRKVQAFGDRLKSQASDRLDEQGRDYLGRMQNAAGRMQSLINDLLSFARVTTHAKPFAPVDLSQITREVLADLEVRIEQAGARVQVDPLPTIVADAVQMRQLLQNLVANALKFRRPGVPPVVSIAARASAAANSSDAQMIELCVRDNGIGFDMKYADKVFAMFQRLHGRDEYEGTGIGLAICRKIAERHGGSISVESAAGSGTTFRVFLPLTQSTSPRG